MKRSRPSCCSRNGPVIHRAYMLKRMWTGLVECRNAAVRKR
ncbi:Uncharacterised protein [Mycobacteroides abscessus]|nr:Uncharacterised protein [Mycobacteroides abscessus]